LPAVIDLYPLALATYLGKMSPRRNEDGTSLTTDEYLAEITARLDEFESGKEGLTKGIADWSRTVGKQLGELNYKPSPSSVARECAFLLQEAVQEDIRKGHSLKRARELAKWIAKALDLPALIKSQESIFEETDLDTDALA
jgi:hypothetical protein